MYLFYFTIVLLLLVEVSCNFYLIYTYFVLLLPLTTNHFYLFMLQRNNNCQLTWDSVGFWRISIYGLWVRISAWNNCIKNWIWEMDDGLWIMHLFIHLFFFCQSTLILKYSTFNKRISPFLEKEVEIYLNKIIWL